jgi:hypothetical protein
VDLDLIVIAAVVLSRFLVPLLIPRFPLPAILASLIIDAVDDTIFQFILGEQPEGYQSYDKALDIYYLAIAYVSTLGSWRNVVALGASRFLWYYRLVGVAAFELTGTRALLIIFPNTFEYFFIWYEALRTRWNALAFTAAHIITAVVLIWVFIKLPQEWWIHVAQLDFTDELKANPWMWGAMALGVAILIPLAIRYLRMLGPPDWSLTFRVEDHLTRRPEPAVPVVEPLFSRVLVERIALTSLIGIIFAQLLELNASTLELVVALTVVIVVNSAVSQWLSRRGTTWRSLGVEFLVMSVFNFGVLLAYIGLRSSFEAEFETGSVFFLVLVFTLIITLFDRYRREGERLEERERPRPRN